MTRLPRNLGSTLVLRLYQETVHDFILLFMPPCGPHFTPLATGSLERSLLVLVNGGFLWEKEMDLWRATMGDPYQMEKSPDEIPMFA
jgi:hypothetical protein